METSGQLNFIVLKVSLSRGGFCNSSACILRARRKKLNVISIETPFSVFGGAGAGLLGVLGYSVEDNGIGIVPGHRHFA